MLARPSGARLQIHIEHQRVAAGGYQQAAHHLEGGRFTCTVGAEQSEDLTAPDLKVDVVGGSEAAELLGQRLRLDHRLRGIGVDLRHDVGQRRGLVRPAAQQIDKGILKARLGLLQLGLSEAERRGDLPVVAALQQDQA